MWQPLTTLTAPAPPQSGHIAPWGWPTVLLMDRQTEESTIQGLKSPENCILLPMLLTKLVLYFIAIFSEALCLWQAEQLDLSPCLFFASLPPQCRKQYLAERYSNRDKKRAGTQWQDRIQLRHENWSFLSLPPQIHKSWAETEMRTEKSQCTTSDSVLGHVRKKFFCFWRAAGSPGHWAAHAQLRSETRHLHTLGWALHSCTLGTPCEGLSQLIHCNGARFSVSVQTPALHLAELINCQRAARQISSFWETGESSSSSPLVTGKTSPFVQQICIVGFLKCFLMKQVFYTI